MHPKDDDAFATEESVWDLTHTINVKGVWWGCKYAIAAMRNNKPDPARGLHIGGSIISVASFVALLGAATPQLACGRTLKIERQVLIAAQTRRQRAQYWR
jgi:NAD(P)-dependent dehydrogenase (short-subunit alcohol dehydrogenase family)